MDEDMTEYNTVVVNLLSALGRNLDKSINEKISFAGANTGNLIFTEAMKEQLDYCREIWINQAALKGVENPSVVIPSANFIIQGGDSLMQAIIRFLDQTDCPVTMAGLGAQAGENEKPKELVKKLSETQVRAFKMISERAVTVGVRGEFSAECLNLLGIRNVRIIGCPSFYFRKDKRSHKLKIPSLARTQVTITPGSKFESILKMGKQLDSYWLMQMENELPQIGIDGKEWDSQWDQVIQNSYPSSGFASKEIWDYMQQKAVIFFEKSKWDAFYEEKDITFAYGSRFHGNMAAFRNGVPALWIVHDVRTTELTNTLHLPSISYERFAKLRYAEEMLEYCDYREYEKHFGDMYEGYIGFLKENNLRYLI